MKLSTHAGRIALAFVLVSLSGLSAAAQLPAHIKVNTILFGETVELNLSNYSVRSPDFRVQSWDSTSGYVVENLPSRQYRGYVTENPNWLVVAFIDTDDTLDASIHNGSGRLDTVSNIDVSSLLGGGPAPALPTIGIPITNSPPAVGSGDQAPPGPNMPPTNTYSAHGVYDISSRYYRGTVEATLAWEEYKWNLHDYFNTRDAKLSIQLTEVIVRKEQFYTPTTGNAGQFNGMLRTEWLAQGINRRGFIASLFPVNFTYAGGYASGNNFYDAGSEAICVNALYHENAHNWRASHWFYGQDTMSGSHPAHGAMNVMRVLYTRALEIAEATPSNGVELTTNAVTLVHPQAFPDIVSTVTNTPVDIAVLANDWDANGEAISIRYHTTNTVQGGSVTLLGNVLTYTPGSGYVGKDMIIYEVQDTTGLYTEEVVHIEVVNQGLAASWSFEDASGTTATDGSGNSHPGTLSGATFGTSTTPGPVGNALTLASGEYMVCDDSDLIAEPEAGEPEGAYPLESRASNFFDPMDESFTATCWFKMKDSGTVTLFDKDNPGWFGYILYAHTSGLNARVRPWNGIGSSYTVSSGSLQQGAWYHAAMVINRADHSLRLYLNGAEVGTAATLPSDEFIFNGREDLVMGGGAAVDIDEAQIHTKALSLVEIQALHNAGDVPAGGPQPADGAVNQSVDNTVLEWVEGNPSYLHNVYFGTDAAAVATATTGSPEFQGQQAGTSFDPGTLSPVSTYYWRVDEVDGGTIIPGPVWKYSTAYSELLSDLVLHLSMDNDDVQTADGVTHTYDDIAVPAQDFFPVDATAGATGIIGEAIDLTGTTNTLRSYVVSPVVKPASGGITISFWINTTSTQNGAEKVYDFGGAVFMHYYNGDLRPVFDGSSGGATIFDTNINDGNWHHIIARNDGAGTTTLFVDGAIAGTQSESLYDLASLGRTAALGSTYDSTGENLEASYDDFAVWQRSLSNGEVSGIRASGLIGQSFNHEPVVVNTSFEAAEGFTGFTAGLNNLGTVVDNDGVTWTEDLDAKIWNSTTIPPAGIQTLTLGEGNSPTPSCTVQIPGTLHGVGLVSFDYASFSGAANTDFSLSYNDNAGSGWVEVWSSHMSGTNPDWTVNPWSTVEVGVYVDGDVDLRFSAAGSKGPMIDNVRITGTGSASNLPPAFVSDPFSAATGLVFAAYSDTLSSSVTDPNGDPLTYSKVSGPAWLNIATNGTLSGTPAGGDIGLNQFTVEVADDQGGTNQATLQVTILNSGSVFFEDFESYDAEDQSDFSVGGTPTGNWTASSNVSQANRIYNTSNYGGSRLWVSDVDGTSLTSAGIPVGSDANYDFSVVLLTETSTGNRTVNATYDLLVGSSAAVAVSVIGGPQAVLTHGDDWVTPDSKVDHVFTNSFTTGILSPGDQLFVRINRLTDQDNGGGYIGVDDIQLDLTGLNSNPPQFTSDPFSTSDATEDAAYNATIAGSATDLDGDPLTYSKTGGPPWLNVATNGVLSGTPGNGNVGVNAFTVEVDDGTGGTDTATLNITVLNVNDDPVFTSDPFSTANAMENQPYSDTIAGSATDVDAGDTLTYSKVGSTPAWLNVAGSGALSGTPGSSDVGLNAFTVQVVDGNGGTNTATLNIFVDAYALTSRSYTESGTDFTGTTAGGAYMWGMDVDPINNVGSVDLDGNGIKDFHESDTTPVNPSDGLASHADGTLFRWDYGGSPSREAGLESTDMSYTLEVGLDIKNTGTEGSRGVFGLDLMLTDDNNHGRLQMEIKRNSIVFLGGTHATNVLTSAAATQSNIGFHAWRIAYDQVTTELFIYRDGELLNKDGIGIPGATNLGNPTQALIGDYSSGLSGDWELDYIVLDTTGAYGPSVVVSTPPAITLGGTGTDITLSWIGESGITYGVQTNANLIDGIWNTYISGLVGDGSTLSFTNDIDTAEMFFRIIVE